MHSALKHIIVFVTLQRHLNDRRGVKFVTFFRKFTKSKLYFTWNSYWHVKKAMFTKIKNESLKCFVMIKKVKSKKALIQLKILI